MKTVQMTLNDELIQQVDTIAKENNTSRSAFTREALTRAVHHYKELQLEKKQQKGYLKHPTNKDTFNEWEDEQEWGTE
jgi:metal-responsive CopG/Arc/MetJ family transcriptional regulator